MIVFEDRGPEVSKLQKNLSMLGYDLIIDGYFGVKTLRSLKAFQKKYGLLVDGIVDKKNLLTLKSIQKRALKEEKDFKHSKKYFELNIDVNNNQSTEQYIRQTTTKNKIFIRHNNCGPDANSIIKNWDRNLDRTSSAFIISGDGFEDGKIYEAFNPDYWSYHLGLKGTKGRLDKSSIGIDICSWGSLNKNGDNFFNSFGKEIPREEVFIFEKPWRENSYYHCYTEKQLKSLKDLLLWIVKEYKIPVQNIDFNQDWLEYDDKLINNKEISGIFTHTSVRIDKSNIYPDERLFKVLNEIRTEINLKL